MVRRGSTVRVRQRALQKRRKSRLFLSRAFAGTPVCGACGALYGAFRIRGHAPKRRKWAHSQEGPRQAGPLLDRLLLDLRTSRGICARHTDQVARGHTAKTPNDQVLRWAASAVDGTRVLSTENLSRSDHRASGTFRLRIDGPAARATDVILKVPVPRWILDGMVITNARALQLAETHGLAAPRLIAADLDGRASGTVATLETFLSGSSDLPPTVSVARLREAGAAIARVHAFSLESQADMPHRPRPMRRRRPRRRPPAGLDADHTPPAAGRQAGQVARRARGRVGVPAWRHLGRQHAVGGRPLRRADRLEDGRRR